MRCNMHNRVHGRTKRRVRRAVDQDGQPYQGAKTSLELSEVMMLVIPREKKISPKIIRNLSTLSQNVSPNL